MTSAHTPVPWRVLVGEDDFDVLPAGRQGSISCGVINSADATLISAAPELLAALDETSHMLEAVSIQLQSWGKRPVVNFEGALERARAIMSKATGGDQ